jgi:allantoin racemase
MLGCIREADRDGADAHIIACFDDTGLDAARAAAKAPVIGIGEAGFHIASLIAARFAVVTTLGVSIVPIEHNLRKYGLAERCARVRAAEVPVLALEERNTEALAKISAEITAAIRDDRAEAIVLGCAGMADLANELAATHGLPVVDGVEDVPAGALCGAAVEDLCWAVFVVSALKSRSPTQRSVGKSRRGASFLALSLFFVPIVAEQ